MTDKWRVAIFPSGSTIVTNGNIAMYLFDHKAIMTGETDLTDAELDAKKLRYAQAVARCLNDASLEAAKDDFGRHNHIDD